MTRTEPATHLRRPDGESLAPPSAAAGAASVGAASRVPDPSTTAPAAAPRRDEASGSGSAADAEPQALDVAMLGASFDLVAGEGTDVVSRFYDRLFERAPAVRGLFPDDMGEQRRVLLATLRVLRRSLHDLPALLPTLRQLGARHVRYGARAEHYPVVAAVLVEAMTEAAGPRWPAGAIEQWEIALGVVGEAMLAGAGTTETPSQRTAESTSESTAVPAAAASGSRAVRGRHRRPDPGAPLGQPRPVTTTAGGTGS